MKPFIAFILKHKYYREVIDTFEHVLNHYRDSLEVWSVYKNITTGYTFPIKEEIVKDYNHIIEINSWIKTSKKLFIEDKEGLLWYLKENGYDSIPKLEYKELRLIFDNQITIKQYENIIQKVHRVQEKYPASWQYFSYGKNYLSIPIKELGSINESYFETKEQCLNLVKINKKQIFLFLGTTDFNIGNFSEENYTLERKYIEFATSEFPELKTHIFDLRIKDTNQLKSLILNSRKYGDEVKFVDSFSITKFYNLRKQCDELNMDFDEIVDDVKRNKEIIKQYNYNNSGEEVVYIEDYISSVTEGTDLYKYIESINKTNELRHEARELSTAYSLGYQRLFDKVDPMTCEISLVNTIISQKQNIAKLDHDEKIKREKQEKIERQRILELQQKQKIVQFRNCVSDWYTHTWNGEVKHNWFYDYYSYRDNKHTASSSMWDTWKFVWHFKNDPHATVPVRPSEHKEALDKAVRMVEDTLKETFGDDVSSLTLVCLTASTREKNELRFKPFAERVCDDLNMYNAYSHINITSEGEAKHEGGTGVEGKSYDTEWFKDKYVVLFDDVRTSGTSISNEKRILESLGAHVICALTLAQTTD